ncbi:MAG: pilus assembly protein TadG-related protein [Desulfobaccales bacterium]
MKTWLASFHQDTRGASAFFVAISIFLLLTTVGLVIDLGHLYVVKQELQNAADAGASAGAMSLYWLGTGTDPQDAKDLLSCEYAHLKAVEVVNQNRSDNNLLAIPVEDVQVGVWQYNGAKGIWEFETLPCDPENAYNINAVRVTTRRTQAVNGPVNLIFARLLGIPRLELTGQATAMLGWVRSLRPGAGFPIAVGDNYVPPVGERMWVTFSPDHSDTGGWHSFLHPAASARYISDLITGDEASDLIKVGDFIEMQNGVADSTINTMQKEFYHVHGGDWTVILPVIPAAQTYNQQREVLGFVAFEVVTVDKKEKSVSGWIRGGYICPGSETSSPSGGGGLALRASLPKLVQ